MKRLLLLLILPILACSHEHPLTEHQHHHTHDHEHSLNDHEHQHEHGLPEHDHRLLFPQGLPFTYILSVDPSLAGPGYVKFGVLTTTEDDRQVVYIDFSKEPRNLTLTDINYPGKPSTPVDSWGLSIRYDSHSEYVNQSRVWTDCSDSEHEGNIAWRFDWDTGFAEFRYSCPEEEE